MLEIINISEIDTYGHKKNFEGRICCKCKDDNTGKNFDGNPHWYICHCHKIGCTGHLCTRCKGDIYNQIHINKIKYVSNSRTGQLLIGSETGKGLIGEAIIANIRNLDIISIKLNNFKSKFDLSFDLEYGYIQSKFRFPYYGDWITNIGIEHNFDNLFFMCIGNDKKDIERIYIIPEKELYGLQTVKIIKTTTSGRYSKWEKFRMKDIKQYNGAYHKLIEFLKDKKYFGINDIKKWLEMSEVKV